jgi:hypothetical protein
VVPRPFIEAATIGYEGAVARTFTALWAACNFVRRASAAPLVLKVLLARRWVWPLRTYHAGRLWRRMVRYFSRVHRFTGSVASSIFRHRNQRLGSTLVGGLPPMPSPFFPVSTVGGKRSSFGRRDYGVQSPTWSPACHEQLSWRFHWWGHSHSVPVRWRSDGRCVRCKPDRNEVALGIVFCIRSEHWRGHVRPHATGCTSNAGGMSHARSDLP